MRIRTENIYKPQIRDWNSQPNTTSQKTKTYQNTGYLLWGWSAWCVNVWCVWCWWFGWCCMCWCGGGVLGVRDWSWLCCCGCGAGCWGRCGCCGKPCGRWDGCGDGCVHLGMWQWDCATGITARGVEATAMTVGQAALVAVWVRAHCTAGRVLIGTRSVGLLGGFRRDVHQTWEQKARSDGQISVVFYDKHLQNYLQSKSICCQEAILVQFNSVAVISTIPWMQFPRRNIILCPQCSWSGKEKNTWRDYVQHCKY